MEITSFYFLIFYACVLLVYYLVPAKHRWLVLVAAGAFFYAGSVDGGGLLTFFNHFMGDGRAAEPEIIPGFIPGPGVLRAEAEAFLYPLAALTAGYTGALAVSRGKHSGAALSLTLLVLFGVLAAVKYLRFGSGAAVPLGISFYTFSVAGYCIDVYNGLSEPIRNPLRLALYAFYFPLLISGPIVNRKESGAAFDEPHRFDYRQVTFGMQRMVWGFFKKLVIAERAGIVASTVFGNYEQYPGTYIWIGALMFTIQLYADFSGCMDIVLGLSETFGIVLPENFHLPFLAKSISEYWRRWHITLGVWMRNCVFYPLLRTRLFTGLDRKLRAKLGKKKGKQLNTHIAMFVLWLTVGLWHGGAMKYVIGSGLLHWLYIVTGEWTLPFFTALFRRLRIPMKGKAADAFRVARTFLLVNIGNVFFRADSVPSALGMLKGAVTVFNPGVLFDGSLFSLGLDWIDMGVLAVSVVILIAVSLANEKKPVRERVAARPLPLRWAAYFALLFYVILLGNYGPGYSAAEFIYQGF